MASYKVAQDVEAEDKLLGPFSFRQFVYLIIVAIAGALAWGLFKLFPPLVIIPLPIILFFGALALPLRKDQPMEVYLAAILSFYLKPRKRLWAPDGIDSLIEITAPKEIEVQRTKDLSQNEAEQRLSYLADIADTGGWAVRHAVAQPVTTNAMASDAYFAAQQTEDMLDENGGVAQSLGSMINQADEQRKQEMVNRMHQMATQSPQPQQVVVPPIADPYATLAPSQSQPQSIATHQPTIMPQYNPYPTEIHQSIIQPLEASEQLPVAPQPITPAPAPAAQTLSQNPAPTTSETPVSPDIINLANNSDLSVETIQREANRIKEKHDKDKGDEVFISLR